MVAIVSGDSLGLSNTSAATLRQNGLIGQSELGANNEQAVVNVSNGNLVLQSDDDFLAGEGLNINSVLTYNSQGNASEGNGYGWSMGMIKTVGGLTGTVNTAGSTITRTDGDGSQVVYIFNGTNYVGHEGAGANDTLSFNVSQGVWTWTSGSTGVTETYGANGYITGSTDLNGNQLTYTYTAGLLTKIADANGDSTTYVYNANGNLSQINDQVSGTTTTRVYYSYNASNQLVGVTTDLNPSESSISNSNNVYWTHYGYNAAGQISSVTQKNGAQLNITYVQVNGQEYVQTTSDAFGNTTTYNYSGNQTTVTDPHSNVSTYTYDAQGRLLTVTPPVVNGITQKTTYTYDNNGDLASVTDALGNKTTYQYDGNGNLLQKVDPVGDTTTYTYNSSNRVTSSTVYLTPATANTPAANPQTTYFVYNANNELAFEISPAGRVTQNSYDSVGNLTATVTYSGNLYISGAAGGPSTPLSPTNLPTLAQMTAWASSPTINLTQTNPTHYTYNTRGQLASVIEYTSVSSTGVLSAGKTTQYTYNAEGQLLQTIDGDSNLTSYTYDSLGRQLSVTNANLSATVTVYNDATTGTVVTKTLASGLAMTSSYNADGELISVVESNANANNAVLSQTTYAYDANGNLLMVTNPEGKNTYYLYDADNRQIASITSDGGLTQTCYNADNQVSAVIQYANFINTSLLTTSNGSPAAPSLSALINPTGGTANPVARTSLNVYDNVGRLVYTVDAAGYVTQTSYDGSSNAVSMTAYANALTSAQLQALGTSPTAGAVAADIVAATGTGDRTTRNFYDSDNLLVGTLNANGYLTQYVRDGVGQITQTIAYANAPAVTAAALATDSLSTLLAAIPASTNDIVDTNFYNAEGLLAYALDGDGYLTAYTYDSAGNLTQETRYATQVKIGSGATAVAAVGDAQVGVAFGNLVWTTNSEDHTTKYTYTALNQVATETDPSGVITAYAYDNVGNLISTTVSTGSTDTNARTVEMRYNLQGQLVAELSGNAVAQITSTTTAAQIAQIWATQATTYTYDAGGNRTSMTDADGNRTLYYYDAENRLVYTIDAMGEVHGQTYTNLGQVSQTTIYNNTISAVNLATMTGGALTAGALSIIDALPNAAADRTTTYTYDVRGELASTKDALGNTVTNTYDAFGDIVTTLTQVDSVGDQLEQDRTYDNLGQVTSSSSYENRSHLTSGTDNITAATSAKETTSAKYDAFGRVIQSTDANGNAVNMTYDQLGREIAVTAPASVTGPASSAIAYTTYDAFDRTLTHTDFNGNVTSTVYNTAAHSMTISVSATTPTGTPQILTQTIVDNEFGQRVSVTDGNGNVTNYNYDHDGNLVSVADSLGTLQTDSYDAADNLITSTSAASVGATGVVTNYTYDGANRVLKKTVDPTGLNLVTQYTYNSSSQVLSVTDPKGIVTQTTYDQKGQVTSVTIDPVTALNPNGLNLQTSYVYNAIGQTLQVTDPNGNQTVYRYNALGQRISQTVASGKLNLTTTYSYDSNNNLISATDPNGNITNYVYNAANRVIYKIDGAGDVTQNTYDADGNVTRTTRYANPISAANLAVINGSLAKGVAPTATQINGMLSADPTRDNTINNVYDSANRLVYTVDGMGSVTQYTYDGNGNVTEQTAYATSIASNVSLTLNGIYTAVATSAADRTVANVYDARNRVIATATAQGSNAKSMTTAWSVVSNTYDANGNLVARTAYASKVSTTNQPVYGSIVAMINSVQASTAQSVSQDQTTRMVYDNAGRVIYTATSQGFVAGVQQWSIVQNTYDQDGHVVAQTSYGTTLSGASLAANPTSSQLVAWITAFTGTATTAGTETLAQAVQDRKSLMVYDNAGRLIYSATAQNRVNGVPQWSVVKNSYDLNGNLVQTTAYGTFLSSLTQGTQTNTQWIESIASNPATDRTTQMTYDGANRLVQTQTSQSVDANNNIQWATVAYTLDGAGNVIVRTAYALGSSPQNDSGLQDRVSIMSYDAANRLVAMAVLQNATTIPNPANPATNTNSYNFAITTKTYDGAGNVVSQTAYSKLLSFTGATGSAYNLGSNLSQWVQQNAAPQFDRTTNYVYDADHRLIYSIDPMGFVMQNFYDAVGNLTSTELYSAPVQISGTVNAASVAAAIQAASTATQTNAAYQEANRITTFVYDATGRVLKETDAIGGVQMYTYDALGNKLQYTNAMNNSWNYDYDAQGRVIEQADPETQVTTATNTTASAANASLTTVTAYDAFGDVASVTTEAIAQANGVASNIRMTNYGYDLAGHQISAATPNMIVLNTQAVTASSLLVPQNTSASNAAAAANSVANGATVTETLTSTVTYDALGNAVQSVDEAGNVSYKVYNNAGEVAYAIDANGYVTGYTYDAFGDVASTTRYANSVVMPNSTLAASPQALEVSQLYTAILGFAPTPTAWAYWTKALQNGATMSNIAQAFVAYGQSVGTFPSSMTGAAFVNQLYQNALGRQPSSVEANNLAWVNTTGQNNWGTAAADFIVGVVNEGTGTADGAHFTTLVASNLAQSVNTPVTPNFIQGMLTPSALNRTITTRYDLTGRGTAVIQPQVYVYDLASGSTSTLSGITASQITTKTYDAFGDTILTQEFGGQANGNGGFTVLTDDRSVYSYLNQDGEVTAQINATTDLGASGATPEGYLTTMAYDAAGNMVQQYQYADEIGANPALTNPNQAVGGTWNAALQGTSATPYTTGSSSVNDRQTTYQYDGDNRKVSQTLVNTNLNVPDDMSTTSTKSPTPNITTTYGYDLVGNLVSTTDALGDVDYTYYDALSRVTATAIKSGTSSNDGIPQVELQTFGLDVYGNVVQQVAYANSATITAPAGVNPGSYTATASANDRKTTNYYNANNGKVTQSINAAGNTTYTYYNADGQVALQWQLVTTTSYASATPAVQSGGLAQDFNSSAQKAPTVTTSTQVEFTLTNYDSLGQVTSVITPGAQSSAGSQQGNGSLTAAVTTTANTYDAFGEALTQSVDGVTTTSKQYDNAGKVWNSTVNGITTATLYNIEGQATEVVNSSAATSSGVPSAFQSESQVGALVASSAQVNNPTFNIAGNIYDLQGNVVEHLGPEQQIGTTAASSLATLTATAVVTSSSTASNTVQIGLSPAIASLGNGDLMVQINYTVTGSSSLESTTQTFTANQLQTSALGSNLTMTWGSTSNSPVPAVGIVKGIQVWKKDISGQWQQLIDTNPQMNASGALTPATPGPALQPAGTTYLLVPAPQNTLAPVGISFTESGLYAPVGSQMNFGNMILVNTSFLSNGDDTYTVSYTGLDGKQVIQDTGVLNLSSPLNTTNNVGEYYQQISQVYQAVLNRPPAETELNYWIGQLNAGVPLYSFVQSAISYAQSNNIIATGAQFIPQVLSNLLGPTASKALTTSSQLQSLSQTYMGQISSPGGQDNTAQVVLEIINQFADYAGGNAVIATASKAFDASVQLTIDSPGLALAAASTPLQLAKTQIAQLYVAICGYAPSATALNNYASQLTANPPTTTLAAIANQLVASTPINTASNYNWSNTNVTTFVNQAIQNVYGTAPNASQSAQFVSDYLTNGAGQTMVDIINALQTATTHTEMTQMALFNNQVAVALTFAQDTTDSNSADSIQAIRDATATDVSKSLLDIEGAPGSANQASDNYSTNAANAAAAAATADKTAAAAAAASANNDANLSVQLTQLYMAIVDRPPQTYEMWYNVETLEKSTTPATLQASLLAMATTMFGGGEAAIYYPTSLSASAFVTKFYQITFGRSPTAQELSNGLTALAGGQTPASRASFALSVIQGIESYTAPAGMTDLTTLETQYLFNDRVQQGLQTIETGAENTSVMSNTAVSGQAIYATPTTQMTYDRYGNQLSISNPASGTVTYSSYNVFNEVTATYAPYVTPGSTPGSSAQNFVPANNPFTSTWLSPTTSDTTYDVLGRAISKEDANTNVTQMAYDGFGNLQETVDADGGVILYTNDAFGERTSLEQLNPNGTTTVNGVTQYSYTILSDTAYIYDLMGHEVESESAAVTLGDVQRTNVLPDTEGTNTGGRDGAQLPYNFDSQVALSAPAQKINLYGYNELGELAVSLITSGNNNSNQPDGISTTEFADLQQDNVSSLMGVLSGQLATQNTPTNAAPQTDNDAVGDINTISYSQFDLAGNVTDTVNGNGSQTLYGYDALHNKIAEDDANGKTQSWVMNGGGSSLVATWNEMGGNIMNYTYNQDGQLTGQNLKVLVSAGNYRTDTINYTYTGTLLASLSTFNNVIDNDSLDTNDPDITTKYSYDLSGNQISAVTSSDAGQPGNEVVIQNDHETYDPLNRVSSIEDSRYKVQYTYDANGNVLEMATSYLQPNFDTVVSATGTSNTVAMPSNASLFSGVSTLTSNSELTTAQETTYQYASVTNYSKYDSMNRAILVDGTGSDSANTTVNGISTSEISWGQGHILTYNAAGQRTSDTYYTGVTSQGTTNQVQTTENYAYDAAGELAQITRNGYVIDNLEYDAAGAVVASGVTNTVDSNTGVNIVSYNGSLANINNGTTTPTQTGTSAAPGLNSVIAPAAAIQSYGLNYTSENSFYDLAGHVQTQTIWSGAGSSAGVVDSTDIAYAYDGVGNVTAVATHQHPQGNTSLPQMTDTATLMTTSWTAGATYQQAFEVSALYADVPYEPSASVSEGANATTFTYSDFGNLLSTEGKNGVTWNASGVSGGTQASLTYYKSTIDGEVGQSVAYGTINTTGMASNTPGGLVMNTLLANNQSLGSSGITGNSATITIGTAVNYSVLSSGIDNSQPSIYTVASGDTWNSIAYNLWGNSNMAWAIQEANGGGTAPAVNSVIVVPPEPSAVQNNSQTYTPYNISSATGNLTPPTPTPQMTPGNPNCGVIGEIVEVVIAAVVTYFTAGAADGALATMFASDSEMAAAAAAGTTVTATAGEVVAGAAIGGAAGAVAGQFAGNLMGLQDGFSLQGIALGALGGAISAGVGTMVSSAPSGSLLASMSGNPVGVAAQMAVSNAITQGIAVETHLQPHFEWNQVAMAALSAGAESEMGIPTGATRGGTNQGITMTQAVEQGLVGAASGALVKDIGGSQESYSQIVVNAFGNAIGNYADGNYVGPYLQQQQQIAQQRQAAYSDQSDMAMLRANGVAYGALGQASGPGGTTSGANEGGVNLNAGTTLASTWPSSGMVSDTPLNATGLPMDASTPTLRNGLVASAGGRPIDVSGEGFSPANDQSVANNQAGPNYTQSFFNLMSAYQNIPSALADQFNTAVNGMSFGSGDDDTGAYSVDFSITKDQASAYASVLKGIIGQYNAGIVNNASANGLSLAPTIANFNNLGLIDTTSIDSFQNFLSSQPIPMIVSSDNLRFDGTRYNQIAGASINVPDLNSNIPPGFGNDGSENGTYGNYPVIPGTGVLFNAVPFDGTKDTYSPKYGIINDDGSLRPASDAEIANMRGTWAGDAKAIGTEMMLAGGLFYAGAAFDGVLATGRYLANTNVSLGLEYTTTSSPTWIDQLFSSPSSGVVNNGEQLVLRPTISITDSAAGEPFVAQNSPNYVDGLPFNYKAAPFGRFVSQFYDLFSAAGYDDVEGYMQGSSVTGQKYDGPTLDSRAGILPGDYDVAVTSDKLVQRANELGIDIYNGELSDTAINQLGLSDAQNALSAASKYQLQVNFKIYPSIESVYGYGPTIPFSIYRK